MLVTVQQAASELQVHPNTVYKLIKRNRLIAWKNGKGFQVSRLSLDFLRFREKDRLGMVAQAVDNLGLMLEGYTTPMGLFTTGRANGHHCHIYKAIYVNESMRELQARPAAQVMNQTCFHEWIHPDDKERVMQGDPNEFRMLRPTGHVWIRAQRKTIPALGLSVGEAREV